MGIVNKTVAVLGGGPAGLMAAHAVGLAGIPAAVFTTSGKSLIGGAQFLHTPIPMLTDDIEPAVIRYSVRGNELTYREKVYGKNPQGIYKPSFVSMEHVIDGETADAYPLNQVYDRLWDFWSGGFNTKYIDSQWLENETSCFAAVISTIPLPAICRRPEDHHFSSITIKVAHEAMEELPDNTILYEGTNERTWYRASNLFGLKSTEWGVDVKKPPLSGIFELKKPIAHTCDCWPEIIKVGRFGEWKKGKLVSDAFVDTVFALHERGLF